MAKKSKDQRGNDVPVVSYNTNDSERGGTKSKWWAQPEEEMHKHVFAVVKAIRDAQSYRTVNNLRFARLYSNMEIMGLQAGLFARVENPGSFMTNRSAFNVVQSCIDTAASKIAKNKPRPLFLTDDGDWSLQRRAQFMTKYMEGLYDTMGTGLGDARSLYGMGRRAFVDSGVFGTGAVKFFREDDEVKAERVIIEEIVVDETEGMYELPRQLHQEKFAVRDVLCDVFPKQADAIMAAKSPLPAGVKDQADMIQVVESWHIPSGGSAKDGRKALSVENCTLDVDDWKKDYFPFLFQRWSPRIMGFYGQGIAEQLIGIQLEINKILRTIYVAQHLMSAPQVWLEVQNKIAGSTVSNEIGGKHYYTGRPPVFMTPGAMSAEVYQHLENLYRKAYELIGISQLSANAQKPAGLDSRVALREYQDIESERFQLAGQRYEDFYMDAARISMDLLNDIAKDGKNPAIRIRNGMGSKEIKWKDVCMDPKDYQARPFPTALLPSQPAGKLQKVQELTEAGFFDKEESLELLDFPDISGQVSVKLAPRADIKRMVENMVEHDVYESPEPYMNLAFGRQYAQSYYLKGRTQGMPEEKLELLRRFMDDCQATIERGQVPPAPVIDPAAPTMAQPEAQPTSDLLPVAAGA